MLTTILKLLYPFHHGGDIRLAFIQENNNIAFNDGNIYNITVVKDPEHIDNSIVYAITLNDLNALETQIALEMNKPKILKELDTLKKIEKINKNFGRKFNSVEDNADDLETKFLEVFADYGITFYKLNELTNNWEKLKLENNTLNVEPCNN
ncbi:hypothetical protein N7U66_04320 [Lacinutrix neustonica]|uniref:Uncharacterized protein n=1 Tax=Lacinutrix neustonica TaxID=2980107 RepID=A0A9E8MZ16_9FLAO|nr:hypothetical protein [Lacinutrix neustonica]WAC02865.1 hypothetical protein N7U66_04320 [Lacinutrix neustonica]